VYTTDLNLEVPIRMDLTKEDIETEFNNFVEFQINHANGDIILTLKNLKGDIIFSNSYPKTTTKLPVEDHIKLKNLIKGLTEEYEANIKRYLPGFKKLKSLNIKSIIEKILPEDYQDTIESLAEAIA
jgi:hypothetical protein